MAGSASHRKAVQKAVQNSEVAARAAQDWLSKGEAHRRVVVDKASGAIAQANQYCEPENPRVEIQDWFTPWRTLASVTDEQNDAFLDIAVCFVSSLKMYYLIPEP